MCGKGGLGGWGRGVAWVSHQHPRTTTPSFFFFLMHSRTFLLASPPAFSHEPACSSVCWCECVCACRWVWWTVGCGRHGECVGEGEWLSHPVLGNGQISASVLLPSLGHRHPWSHSGSSTQGIIMLSVCINTLAHAETLCGDILCMYIHSSLTYSHEFLAASSSRESWWVF